MAGFTDLANRDTAINFGDLVQGIMNGAMRQSCDEHSSPILH
jgi:hypothetical protein